MHSPPAILFYLLFNIFIRLVNDSNTSQPVPRRRDVFCLAVYLVLVINMLLSVVDPPLVVFISISFNFKLLAKANIFPPRQK